MASILRLRQSSASPEVVPQPPTSLPLDRSPTIAHLFEQLPGEPCYYRWHDETAHYRVLGEGPPLLLVYSPDVGASCLEWRCNLEPLAEHYRAYAVDLPGYGLSNVNPHAYTAELYIEFLTRFLQDVCGSMTRIIASVRGASYAVHVAVRHPELVERLLLVSPAGLSSFRPLPFGRAIFRVLSLSIVWSTISSATTSHQAILEHLQRDVYDEVLLAGERAVETRYQLCHRPNGEWVERSRLAGLMNVDIRSAVWRLQKPIMLIWGRHATSPPLDEAEVFHELNPSTQFVLFERSSIAPHEEEPKRFNETAQTFLNLDFVPRYA